MSVFMRNTLPHSAYPSDFPLPTEKEPVRQNSAFWLDRPTRPRTVPLACKPVRDHLAIMVLFFPGLGRRTGFRLQVEMGRNGHWVKLDNEE